MISKEGRLTTVSSDPDINHQTLVALGTDPVLSKEIRVLDLRYVPLHTLPIAPFVALEAIYLHENGLSVLPELHHFPLLHTLSLGKNQFRSLPKSIKRIWMSLRRLILGSNCIASLPFVEDEMMLEQGSIGSNPIPEPVGVAWMYRKDAQQAVAAMQLLSRPKAGTPRGIVSTQLELFAHNCRLINEPMLYEALFNGYEWKEGIGLVHEQLDFRFENEVLTSLLSFIQPEVMVHRSIAEKLQHRFC